MKYPAVFLFNETKLYYIARARIQLKCGQHRYAIVQVELLTKTKRNCSRNVSK